MITSLSPINEPFLYFNTNQKPLIKSPKSGDFENKNCIGRSPDPFSFRPNIKEEKAVWLRETTITRKSTSRYKNCVVEEARTTTLTSSTIKIERDKYFGLYLQVNCDNALSHNSNLYMLGYAQVYRRASLKFYLLCYFAGE